LRSSVCESTDEAPKLLVRVFGVWCCVDEDSASASEGEWARCEAGRCGGSDAMAVEGPERLAEEE
jgi:hypothetical protein